MKFDGLPPHEPDPASFSQEEIRWLKENDARLRRTVICQNIGGIGVWSTIPDWKDQYAKADKSSEGEADSLRRD